MIVAVVNLGCMVYAIAEAHRYATWQAAYTRVLFEVETSPLGDEERDEARRLIREQRRAARWWAATFILLAATNAAGAIVGFSRA